MTYTAYFDLTLRSGQGGPDEAPAWDRLGRVWRLVHGVSRKQDISFAVAFPYWMQEGFTLGPVLRIFMRDRESAERMYDAIEQAPGIVDLVTGSRIRRAPEAPAAFEAYIMHRIPSGISKVRKTIPAEVQEILRAAARQRRLTQQQGLPFVRMRSSTGNLFRLVIDRLSAPPDAQGVPNGYGLSRPTQIVALPVMESGG